ncbi:hypothetical protein LH51_15820 [Nitrincola sp. A-D6]|uniref:1-aminocyclopropane-1-carboxylate deaminase/D-cysteine desulfhydrase n=1 Tax=Nitrincola sp. A-D6 TaxID=1545442 RepID=UPI00051FC0A9|nr:pyridoxal-phosphate dependent enzyme [Nitrincola sp. A-D6]KGK41265.1 hypothetical protein LH51_15820 [Nitrincola sp. A-D6]
MSIVIPQVPLQTLDLPLCNTFGVQFSILHLDHTHPQISGNKWFKLQPALAEARCHPGRPILSFGGAFSNHIHALAYAGQQFGIATIGVIRGEATSASNPTLQDAQRWGMRLVFVSRQEYARRYDPAYISQLQQRLGDFQWVPEGGSSAAAVSACGDIWAALPVRTQPFDYLACAAGTGATAAGLIAARPASVKVLVMPALKISAVEAEAMLQAHWAAAGLAKPEGYQVLPGDLPYARLSPQLAALWWQLSACYGVDLDPVYTLRVFHQLMRMILQRQFAPGSHVALLHTGGMQGLRGCDTRLRRLAPAFYGPLPL